MAEASLPELARHTTVDAGIKTDHIVINMAPAPSTHGVFRAAMLDGETIELKPVMGYCIATMKDRRAQHLPAEPAVHRPAGLLQLDEQQLGLFTGRREAYGRAATGTSRVSSRHHG
jgi:hypothetical protein